MTKKIKEGMVFITTTVTVIEIKDCNVVLEFERLGETRIAEVEHHGDLHQDDLDIYVSEMIDTLYED